MGQSVGHLSLAFMTLGVGMFISSTAFLPSSTSMYLCLLSYGAWFHGRNEVAIFATAVSTLFSWPFAGALGVPIAVDILFRQQRIRFFIEWCILSFLFIALPQIVIDWVYYGKPVFAPLNITSMGQSHGTSISERISQLQRRFPTISISKLFSSSSLSQDIPFVTIYLGFYLWLGIFTLQPHKEERFLFPIYPLICLGGAHSIESLGKIYRAIVSKLLGAVTLIRLWKWIPIAFIAVFSILSCSRLMSLYVNYHAPTSLWIQLNNLPGKASQGVKVEKNIKYTVCVGKEWYRFPTSFFLPSTSWNIEFLKSDFKGQLPRHYEEDDTHATRREEDTRYRVSALDCDFIVDQDTGSEESEREKNYIRHSKVWKEVFSYGMLSS
ncbi:Mannosyltransferase, partial [Caligus rogercresseyi]